MQKSDDDIFITKATFPYIDPEDGEAKMDLWLSNGKKITIFDKDVLKKVSKILETEVTVKYNGKPLV